MTKRGFLVVARLFFGLLTLTAVIVQALYLVQLGVLNPANYLGYFTNLSNIFASIVFIISALYLARSRQPSVTDDLIRGASVLYMAVTGIIYVLLLSGEDLGSLMPWVNFVTHILMPLVVIADWLYQPQQTRLTVKQILVWLVWPLVYAVYTVIRGSIVNWYPYPFLNPANVGGYGGVAVYGLGIFVVTFILGWLLMTLGNRLKRNIVADFPAVGTP